MLFYSFNTILNIPTRIKCYKKICYIVKQYHIGGIVSTFNRKIVETESQN